MRTSIALVVAVGLMVALPAEAQTQPPTPTPTRTAPPQGRRFSVDLGGGAAVPASPVSNAFKTGWHAALGITFDLTERLALEAGYSYDTFGSKDSLKTTLPVPPVEPPITFDVSHGMHIVDANLVFRPRQGAVSPYVLGGGGLYYRRVTLSSTSTELVQICYPEWFICSPTGVAVSDIVGTRTSSDFGIDLGGGIDFKLGRDAAVLFVEARWHYVWGPKFTASDGSSEKANGNYFPITFGVRF